MLFGRVSRKILLAHPKTNSSIFSCQTRLELQMALASMVRWNWKKRFWQQTHQMSLLQTGIKKYPMSTVKYTAGSLMLWAYFSLSTKLIFYHGCPCPLTWTLQKTSEVNWREEVLTWSCESEGSGEILYEENGLWSLIRCSPNSSGIIGENSELLSLEKDVAIIGRQ